MTAISALGAFMWLTYFCNYQTPGAHAKPVESLTRLPAVLCYVTTLVGSPVDDLMALVVAPVLRLGNADHLRLVWDSLAGAIVTLVALACGLYLLRRSSVRQARHAALLGILLFLAMTFVATALGRLNFPLLESTTSSRYTTGVLLFWACLFVLAMSILQASRWSSQAKLLRIQFITFVAVFCLIVINQPIRLIWEYTLYGERREIEAACLNPDIVVPQIWRKVYYSPRNLVEPLRYMKANGLAIYSSPWTRSLGDPIQGRYSIHDGACSGAVTGSAIQTSVGASSVLIKGWAWDRTLSGPPDRIVLANEDHKIIGFGLTGLPAPPDATSVIGAPSDRAGWVAYVLAREAGSRISAFSVSQDGSQSCSIGSLSLSQGTAKPEIAAVAGHSSH